MRASPSHLYTAYPAGGNLVDLLQITQVGNLDARQTAASRMVVPSGACTARPSMVSVTIPYSSLP